LHNLKNQHKITLPNKKINLLNMQNVQCMPQIKYAAPKQANMLRNVGPTQKICADATKFCSECEANKMHYSDKRKIANEN